MTDDREDRIRKRAHQLWEEEGRPSGRESAHWEQAARDIEADDRIASPSKPGSGPARGLGDEEVVADVQSGGVGALGKAATADAPSRKPGRGGGSRSG